VIFDGCPSCGPAAGGCERCRQSLQLKKYSYRILVTEQQQVLPRRIIR
jgi:hypothetical protein